MRQRLHRLDLEPARQPRQLSRGNKDHRSGEAPTKQQSETAPTTAATAPGGTTDTVVVPAPPVNLKFKLK